jgi:hypothetical protein
MKLAKQAAHLFGLSLDFLGEQSDKLKNGLRRMTCTMINAVDFVDQPAATTALFEEKIESGDKIGDQKMNDEKRNLEAELDEVKGQLSSLTGQYSELHGKFEELVKTLIEDEDDKGGDGGKMDDKSADEDEEKMNKMAAKVVSTYLAKTGVQPKISHSRDESIKSVELGVKAKTLAAALKIKEEDFSVKLAALPEEARGVCVELGLNPDEFAKTLNSTKAVKL